MHTRRQTLALSAAAFAAIFAAAPSPSAAFGATPFDQAAFDAALAEGAPVLVDVWASWCPVCRAQSAELTTLFETGRYAGFRAFKVDFDAQKDVARAFGAQRQSTLIVFSGGVERARVVGETRSDAIAALLDAGL